MNATLTVLAIAVPLTIAMLCLAPVTRGAALAFAPWAAAPALLLALLVPAGLVIEVPWIQVGLQLGLQPVTRLFLLFTAILWFASGHFAHGYLRGDPRRVRFTALFMATLAGNVGLIVARDVATFYFFFALMTFAAYGLVIHVGNAEAARAGRVYIGMAVIGEGFLLAGLIAAVHTSGSLQIADVPTAIAAAPGRDAIMALLLIGFGVKAGLLGVHMWLPLAHPIAPTPASAVLSGAMIKAGLLGWLQFLPLDTPFPDWTFALTTLGLAAALFGVIAGLVQSDAKAILAYSSISQMGLMVVAMAVGFGRSAQPAASEIAAFYAAHHGLAKAALFLGVAVVAATGRGSGQRRAVLAALLLPAAALVGAPWTSGAAAKALLEAQLTGPDGLIWVKAWLTAAAVGTGGLMIRLLVALARSEPARHPLGRLPIAAWGMLTAASALAGWWLMSPWAFALTVAPPPPTTGLLPLAAAVILAWVVAGLHRRGWRAPRIPPGDLIAWIDVEPLHRGLLIGVERAGSLAVRCWQWAVRIERRARRRTLVEIGREEFAFPVAAGALVMLVLSTLLILFA
jgi:formate hydrogenlyase subunit 3/multisubunit Na+/H+ antiporter MnhD subunit